mmetsp:Transcript_15369/g.19692  ORF Transcript_15369/g.19692 Transcript_15369/m.19692 type:complete len:531 (-) Transcript_15369:287-1879(-)
MDEWMCTNQMQMLLWFVTAVLVLVLWVVILLACLTHRRLTKVLSDPRNRFAPAPNSPNPNRGPTECVYARLFRMLSKQPQISPFSNSMAAVSEDYSLRSRQVGNGTPSISLKKDLQSPPNENSTSRRRHQLVHANSVVAQERQQPRNLINAAMVKQMSKNHQPKAISQKHLLMLSIHKKMTSPMKLGSAQAEVFHYDWQIPFRELKFTERIAEGSFGEVYKGVWLGTTVAIKTISPKILKQYHQRMTMCRKNSQSQKERSARISGGEKSVRSPMMSEKKHQHPKNGLDTFFEEIAIMAALHHPNVVLFFGACLDKPNYAIVMEYLPINLHDVLHIKRNDDIDWCIIHHWACDIARGMKYLHRRCNLIQRDLKSKNIMIDFHFNAKICDFGLSRHLNPDPGNMTFCGTPFWTAPEIIRQQPYQGKADVYSFGIVLWELITRQPPYKGKQEIEVAFAAANRGLRPYMPLECPPGYASLMQRCWDDNPDIRPDFTEVLDELFMLKKQHSELRPKWTTPKNLSQLIDSISPESY